MFLIVLLCPDLLKTKVINVVMSSNNSSARRDDVTFCKHINYIAKGLAICINVEDILCFFLRETLIDNIIPIYLLIKHRIGMSMFENNACTNNYDTRCPSLTQMFTCQTILPGI